MKGTKTLGDEKGKSELQEDYSTGIDNVTVSGHIGEGLRTVLLDPGDGLGLHNDDIFSLAVVGLERVVVVVFVIVVVDVHERYYLGHDDRWCWWLGLAFRFSC